MQPAAQCKQSMVRKNGPQSSGGDSAAAKEKSGTPLHCSAF
jgi:hypothetical protein